MKAKPATQLDLSGRPAGIRWHRELGADGRFRYTCERCGVVFRGRNEPAHPCKKCTEAEAEARRREREAQRDARDRQRKAQLGMFPTPEPEPKHQRTRRAKSSPATADAGVELTSQEREALGVSADVVAAPDDLAAARAVWGGDLAGDGSGR